MRVDLRKLEPDSPLIQELKTLTRDQDHLIQCQTRLVNQLTACDPCLLSSSIGLVWKIAATFNFDLLTDLSGSSSGDGSFD